MMALTLPPKDDTYMKYVIKEKDELRISLTVWTNKNKLMTQGNEDALNCSLNVS